MAIETTPPAPASAPTPAHPAHPAGRNAGNRPCATQGQGGNASFALLLGGLAGAEDAPGLAGGRIGGGLAPAPGAWLAGDASGASAGSSQPGRGPRSRRANLADGAADAAAADPAAAALAAASAAVAALANASAPGSGGANDGHGDAASPDALTAVATGSAAARGRGVTADAALPTASAPVGAAPPASPSAHSLSAAFDAANLASPDARIASAAATAGGVNLSADASVAARLADPLDAGAVAVKFATGDAAADESAGLNNIFAQMRHVLAHAAAGARGVTAGSGATGPGTPAAGATTLASAGPAGGTSSVAGATADPAATAIAQLGGTPASGSQALFSRAERGGDASPRGGQTSIVGTALGGAPWTLAAGTAGESAGAGGGAGSGRHPGEHLGAAAGVPGAPLGFGAPAASLDSNGWNAALQSAAGSEAAGADALLQRTPEQVLADRVGAWVNQKTHSAELTLDAGGAPVEVRIALSGTEAHVHFRSDQLQTRQMLGSAVNDLRDMLQKEGLVLSGLDVGTTLSGRQSSGSDRAGGGQAQQRGTRAVGSVGNGPGNNVGMAPTAPARIAARGGNGAVDVFA